MSGEPRKIVVVGAGSGIGAAVATHFHDRGDYVLAVNGTPVTSIAALREGLDKLKSTDAMVLQIERDGRLMYLVLEVE